VRSSAAATGATSAICTCFAVSNPHARFDDAAAAGAAPDNPATAANTAMTETTAPTANDARAVARASHTCAD